MGSKRTKKSKVPDDKSSSPSPSSVSLTAGSEESSQLQSINSQSSMSDSGYLSIHSPDLGIKVEKEKKKTTTREKATERKKEGEKKAKKEKKKKGEEKKKKNKKKKEEEEEKVEEKVGWPPEPIDVNTLDLDRSYVGLVKPHIFELGKRQRWINTGETIDQWKDVPKGWNEEEPDLLKDDHIAQIERCLDRIEDNSMPEIFKLKLKDFETLRDQKAARMKQYPGLDWDTVQRLEDIEFLEMETSKIGHDKYNQLVNIKAIRKAYRSGKLRWNQGLVTYWWNGVQRSEPRPYTEQEYWGLWLSSGVKDSFWIEGVSTIPHFMVLVL
ncbi:hypothetical protein N7456_001818 [Penicillium angulare]|uniref:Uncharacterized protein n=1 Tax=Penicillium angulare TaxID=116970 RepID=A0A9W9G781_9EURO|nr:hypothetical protein N7456_001818 [Penicillium angulare]